jgi:peptidoglycan hydrolase CwlO-like protein
MCSLVIVGVLIVESMILWFYYKWTNQRKESEIDTYKKSISDLREIIKSKNEKIKELQDEIERRNNKRLRKNN